jgi:hypothetical protein
LDFRRNFYEEPGMARFKKRTPQVAEVQSYVEGVAKNLADRLWGPKGPAWGTKFTQLEDLVGEIREVLTKKMLEVALERQAVTPPEERPVEFRNCSGCGQPYPRPKEEDPAEPRIVTSNEGEVEWSEPKHYCRRCRQSFFPSVEEFGAGSLAVQQRGAGQDHLRGQQ